MKILKNQFIIISMNRNKQELIEKLNAQIQREIALVKGGMSEDDKMLINSKTFREGIEFGKKYLGIVKRFKEVEPKDPGEIEHALLEDFNDNEKEWLRDVIGYYASATIRDARLDSPEVLATLIADHMNVGSEFHEYIKCAITDEKLPTKIGDGRIRVVDVVDDSQVILSIDRGIKPPVFHAVWNGLSKYIAQDVFTTNETLGSSVHGETERRIIEAWKTGSTYKQISEEFFPNEDYIDTKDRIAKIVQRSGTKRYKVLRNKK